MKKLYYLIVLTLILGLVLTGCTLLSNVGQVPTTEQSGITYLTKHMASDPQKVDLLASQDILVGTVSVWNDCTDLYVKYETTGGWEMTKTHLAVATSLDGIPQAKGNPIPGQFPYSKKHDPAVTEFTYTIPLEGLGTEPVIAAHAKVVRPIEGCYETVWQIGDVEKPICSGDLSNYADEFNWSDPADSCTMGPNLGVEEPLFTDPFIVGETLTNQFPYNSNYNRGYATNFDVKWNGSLPFGGLLTISWSPGASATEKKVVSDDGITSTTFTAYGISTPDKGWFMDKYPLVEHSVAVSPLLDGVHTINFQQIKGDGTFWDWIRLEKPCEQEETAWADGLGFIGKNWATYFNYTVQKVLVDTVYVYANKISTTYSNIILESGKNYQLKVSGTAYAGDTIDFDAKYSITNRILDDDWTDLVSGYESYGPTLLELSVDGEFVAWGNYNPDHVYYCNMPGDGSPLGLALRIYDIYYPNNTGFLTVKIHCMP